jgi:hypothetical protein
MTANKKQRTLIRPRGYEQRGGAQSVALFAEAGFIDRCFRLGADARRTWRQTFIDLLAAILRGRRLNSRMREAHRLRRRSLAIVLDFNLLPRLAPPKKSMEESVPTS